MADLNAAISAMEHARETHAQWLSYWEGLPCKGECEKCVDFAASIGGIDHQAHWVGVYDNVLELLYGLRKFRGEDE